MAHEIEQFADGTAAFVSARVDAWHQLGITLPEEFTAEQAMTHARLGGWNVRKRPAFVQADDGRYVRWEGKYATVRDNPVQADQIDILGGVGADYQVFQNEQLCHLLNMVVDESGAHFETAGSLKGGREVFVTMRLPMHMQIGGVDRVVTYLVILTSHDGSSNIRILTTPIRVVCANTQNAALNHNDGIFTIRHSGNLEVKISEVRAKLGLSFKYLDDFNTAAEKMINAPLREVDFTNKVRRIFPARRDLTEVGKARYAEKIDLLRGLYRESATNTDIRNTRWAGFQAVTEYIDHAMPVRGKNATDEQKAIIRANKALTRPSALRAKYAAFNAFTV